MDRKRPAIYLAAPFNQREEMRAHRYILQDMGYKVTSSWIDQIGDDTIGPDGSVNDLHTASERAIQDMVDIQFADMFFLFTEKPSTTGGRHTELGYAIASQKLITIIGPRENVFQSLATLAWYPNWETFLQALKEANGATETRSPASADTADSQTI